jgi:hypothetical protein
MSWVLHKSCTWIPFIWGMFFLFISILCVSPICLICLKVLICKFLCKFLVITISFISLSLIIFFKVHFLCISYLGNYRNKNRSSVHILSSQNMVRWCYWSISHSKWWWWGWWQWWCSTSSDIHSRSWRWRWYAHQSVKSSHNIWHVWLVSWFSLM